MFALIKKGIPQTLHTGISLLMVVGYSQALKTVAGRLLWLWRSFAESGKTSTRDVIRVSLEWS